jgi:hypothetical protein
MNVSINPSYFCNFRCDFCYLNHIQLGDQTKIDLEVLDQRLAEISKWEPITHVDLYGGEIGALKKEYFYGMRDVIRKYYKDKININTNFSMLHEGFFEDDFYLSVSFDWQAREKADVVFKNMMLSPVPIAVLVLASPKVIDPAVSVDDMIATMNACKNVKSVEIKPYSSNQANFLPVTHKDFERFVLRWLNSPVKKNFTFVNEDLIKSSLKKEYNAFSNDHVYITPSGKFAVLDFDEWDREFFQEYNTFEEVIKWQDAEPYVNCSDYCHKCEYFGHCLTEHYRFVHEDDIEVQGCNGFKGLLDEYKKRVES